LQKLYECENMNNWKESVKWKCITYAVITYNLCSDAVISDALTQL